MLHRCVHRVTLCALKGFCLDCLVRPGREGSAAVCGDFVCCVGDVRCLGTSKYITDSLNSLL
jgi:hypothetical protein